MEFADIHNTSYLFEYVAVLLFIAVAFGIILLAVISSFLIVPQKPYNNKLASYECGMEAFEDARKQFDIRFYLIAVLFIIFDLEIIFMYPWALSFLQLSTYGFLSMIIFTGFLGISFVYEWKKGALQ